jgi:hypothetical protein
MEIVVSVDAFDPTYFDIERLREAVGLARQWRQVVSQVEEKK